jgi:hypothetical protein
VVHLVGAIDRVRHFDPLPVRPQDHAEITRLPAALRIEDGLIEDDSPLRSHGQDICPACGGVCIIAEQEGGGGHDGPGKKSEASFYASQESRS